MKNLDAANIWTHDVVLGPNDRLWMSGLIQGPASGDAGDVVLHIWQTAARTPAGTSVIHLGFGHGGAHPASEYQALVRHTPGRFLALNIASSVLTDEKGSQLAWLGNASVTVSAKNKWKPVKYDVGQLASSERIYIELWGKLIPARSPQFGFTPHTIWYQNSRGEVLITADSGTVG